MEDEMKFDKESVKTAISVLRNLESVLDQFQDNVYTQDVKRTLPDIIGILEHTLRIMIASLN